MSRNAERRQAGQWPCQSPVPSPILLSSPATQARTLTSTQRAPQLASPFLLLSVYPGDQASGQKCLSFRVWMDDSCAVRAAPTPPQPNPTQRALSGHTGSLLPSAPSLCTAQPRTLWDARTAVPGCGGWPSRTGDTGAPEPAADGAGRRVLTWALSIL